VAPQQPAAGGGGAAPPAAPAPAALATAVVVEAGAPEEEREAAGAAKPTPPRWFAALMVFLYPGALGLDESVADCGVRAFSAMLLSAEEASPWGESTFWLMVAVGVGCACATSVWLAAVYRRYETTIALPIEYGALNVCSVAAGLLFYDEARYMQRWQLGCVLGGAAIVMVGIAMSLRATRQPTRATQALDVAARSSAPRAPRRPRVATSDPASTRGPAPYDSGWQPAAPPASGARKPRGATDSTGRDHAYEC
jgi:hypothetical protein